MTVKLNRSSAPLAATFALAMTCGVEAEPNTGKYSKSSEAFKKHELLHARSENCARALDAVEASYAALGKASKTGNKKTISEASKNVDLTTSYYNENCSAQ